MVTYTPRTNHQPLLAENDEIYYVPMNVHVNVHQSPV